MSGGVLVVGAGFAGLAAARALDERPDVTVVDRSPDFDFLPNIHEIVSSRKTPKSVRLPRRKIIEDLGHTFVEDEVTVLDPVRRVLHTSRHELPYDLLVLATGGEAVTDSVPGAREHAITFRSAAEAARIRDRLKDIARGADSGWVTIVGGGLTGVEVLGELLREYKQDRRIRLRLVEGGQRLLQGWPRSLHKRVMKLAEREGVELRLDARVQEVLDGEIVLAGERLPSAVTIWTAGQRAPRFVDEAKLAPPGSRWLSVDERLQVVGHPDILVAGDLADLPRDVAKQASQAIKLGHRAGKNAARIMDRRRPKRFEVEDIPVVLTFGDLATFLIIEDEVVAEHDSLAGLREIIFQSTMAEMDRLSAKGSLGRLIRRSHAVPGDAFELAVRAAPMTMLGRSWLRAWR